LSDSREQNEDKEVGEKQEENKGGGEKEKNQEDVKE